MFALAGHLGRTVAELEGSISVEEFVEWAMLQAIEPWGGSRLDVLSAMQQHAALAPWCSGKIKVQDLIPKWGGESKEAGSFAESAKQLIERARAIADGQNSNRKPNNHIRTGQQPINKRP
jgi:hypothetical protein